LWRLKSKKIFILLDQVCPNVKPGGLEHPLVKVLPVEICMILKFGTQVREALKRPSEFFSGQDLVWWVQNGAPKKPCEHWVLSDW
jgi:hypothetical protein